MISKYTGFQLVGGTRGIPLIKWKMVLSLPLSPPTVLPQNCWFCNYHAFFGHFAHDALTIWTLIGNPNIWWYSLGGELFCNTPPQHHQAFCLIITIILTNPYLQAVSHSSTMYLILISVSTICLICYEACEGCKVFFIVQHFGQDQ